MSLGRRPYGSFSGEGKILVILTGLQQMKTGKISIWSMPHSVFFLISNSESGSESR